MLIVAQATQAKNMKIRIELERVKHVRELAKLYKETTGKACPDVARLFRSLRRLECKASRITTDLCNGFKNPLAQINAEKQLSETIPNSVKRLFGGRLPNNFRINYDPRGYALKLMPPENERGLIDKEKPASRFDLLSDWGSNQILAPDIFKHPDVRSIDPLEYLA